MSNINETIANANEDIIVVAAEEVAKFDFAKVMKTGGKAVGVGLAGYGLFKICQATYTKIKDKKAKAEATAAENENFEEAELA